MKQFSLLILLTAAGMIVSSHTPTAVSTTLEPCRVAPYVNVPSIRLTSSYNQMQSFAGFSPFDPALFTAAQQVNYLHLASAVYLLTFGQNFPIYLCKLFSVCGCCSCILDEFIAFSILSSVSSGTRRTCSGSPGPTLLEEQQHSRLAI